MAEDHWLVAGLGNPPSEYGGTRHNVGADAVRRLAEQWGAAFSPNKRVRAEIAQSRLDDTRVVLMVPSSYMNRSGGPVQAAAAWFKVEPQRLIVCHDDLDLPVGAMRIKRGGGHAGHNGLKDVDRALGTRDYLRVRVGIGRPSDQRMGRQYVLRPFTTEQLPQVERTLDDIGAVVRSLIADGLEPTQNRFHART